MATAVRTAQNSPGVTENSQNRSSKQGARSSRRLGSLLARAFAHRRLNKPLLARLRGQAEMLCQASRLLAAASEPEARDELRSMQVSTRRLEYDGAEELCNSLFTPLMPEDIRMLCASMGRTLRATQDVASCALDLPRPGLRTTVESAMQCAETLRTLVEMLPESKRFAERSYQMSVQARKAELTVRNEALKVISGEEDPVRMMKYYHCYYVIRSLFRCYRGNAAALQYAFLRNG